MSGGMRAVKLLGWWGAVGWRVSFCFTLPGCWCGRGREQAFSLSAQRFLELGHVCCVVIVE